MDDALDVKQQVLQSTLVEIEHSTSESSNPCVICLDEISEEAQAIPCLHQNYDFICLASWLEGNLQCPLCKSTVESIRYDQKSSTEYQTYVVKQNARQPERSSSAARLPDRPYRQRRRRPPAPCLSRTDSLERRRDVYRKSLYSCHVGSNRLSRFQDLTPKKFSEDEFLVSRARAFIRRELRVFEFLDPDRTDRDTLPATKKVNNVEFLLEYTIAILKTVDIKGCGGQAEDMLQEFLGRSNTRLFLHELRAWLRSPYDSLQTWDRHVQYKEANVDMTENESPVHSEGQLRQNNSRNLGRKRRFESPENRNRTGDFYRPVERVFSRQKRPHYDD